jgi:hypothetical protein
MTSEFRETDRQRPDVIPIVPLRGEVSIGVEPEAGGDDAGTQSYADAETGMIGVGDDVVAGEPEPVETAAGPADLPPPDDGSGDLAAAEGEPEPFLNPEARARIAAARERFVGLPYPFATDVPGDHASLQEAADADFDAQVTACAEAAQRAGFFADETTDLITTALESTPDYPMDITQLIVGQVGRTIDATRIGQDATDETAPRDHCADLTDLARTSGEKGNPLAGLTIAEAGGKAGMTGNDAIAVAQAIVDSNTRDTLYANASAATGVLQTLELAGAVSGEIRDAMEHVIENDPITQLRGFNMLDATLAFTLPSMGTGITSSEFIHTISDFVHGGPIPDEALYGLEVAHQAEEWAAGDNLAAVRELSINRHFVDKPGELTSAILPYQTERSLADGLDDLRTVGDAQVRLGQRSAQGVWVHDPDTGKWYSQGGKEVATLEGVSFQSNEFAIGDLSERPLAFFVHPTGQAYDSGIVEFALPSKSDVMVVSQMVAGAGQPVDMRSFIVHPQGVTEFVFPAGDPQALERISDVYQALLPRVLEDSGTPAELVNRVREQGATAVAQQLVDRMNAVLPRGFRLRFHPTGTPTEQIVNRPA